MAAIRRARPTTRTLKVDVIVTLGGPGRRPHQMIGAIAHSPMPDEALFAGVKKCLAANVSAVQEIENEGTDVSEH